MPEAVTREVTQLLQEVGRGDQGALERLIPLVYGNLRSQAAQYLSQERSSHTLQPTALVNEAYLRLVDLDRIVWNDRRHFFAVAATCMRRVLVDHARRRRAKKRGGGDTPVQLEGLDVLADQDSEALLALDDALDALAGRDERKARVAELKLFSGLENAEVAEVLDLSTRTIERNWRLARAWLHREMTGRTG